MNFSVSARAFALVSSLVLVGCGGGGGGVTAGAGTGGSAAPQAVAITETNAKPVAADALGAAQSTSAADLPIGVEVQASGSRAPNYFKAVGRAARLAVSSTGRGVLATGVVTDMGICTNGGSATVSGDGATKTLSFSNCRVDEGDGAFTMNGALTTTLISGGGDSIPFKAVVSVVATDFSIATDGLVTSLNGDMRLDISVSSTSETLVVSGSSLITRFTSGAVSYTDTLRNYSQSLSFNGSVVTGSLSATVESTSTRLGPNGGTYTVTTPTLIVWNESTGLATAGVVKVVGAAGSQLLMTVAANGTVTIQIDANGDGTFESTTTSTASELATLL
jgi:hypothetical protein